MLARISSVKPNSRPFLMFVGSTFTLEAQLVLHRAGSTNVDRTYRWQLMQIIHEFLI